MNPAEGPKSTTSTGAGADFPGWAIAMGLPTCWTAPAPPGALPPQAVFSPPDPQPCAYDSPAREAPISRLPWMRPLVDTDAQV